jgi:hypothetical protein
VPRNRLVLVLVVLVVLALAGGGAVIVATKLSESQRNVRRELRAAAERWGLDPDILDALGYVESKWKLGARSTSAADEALGGSYGPTQLSEATARNNSFDGSMKTLGADAWLSAEWTARSLVAGAQNAEGRVLAHTPETIEDAAAWWNAGRQSAAELSASHVTRTKYIPAALAALDLVRREPLA